MTTGERIRKRREELGLTQTDLALRMGYKSRAAICNVEKDKEDLTTTRIRKFAEALDTTPAYLMGWEEQFAQVQKQLEPYTKQLAEMGKQVSDKLSYDVDLQNGLKTEIERMAQNYEPAELIRAFKFAKAFLTATPERQNIALEILQQSRQGDV